MATERYETRRFKTALPCAYELRIQCKTFEEPGKPRCNRKMPLFKLGASKAGLM